MDKFSSILAIKDAIAGETYSGSLDVYVCLLYTSDAADD